MSKSNSDELDRILWELTDQSAWDLSGITQKQSDDLSEALSADRIEAKELIEAEYSKREQALLDRLDKSMPTPEQLITKYGYYMPEKQYGYKLGLHDIREVIEAERKRTGDKT